MIHRKDSIRPGLLATGLLILASVFGGRAQAGPTYDAVNDFSLASNPNGAWRYGSLSSFTGGTFTAFTSTLVNSDYAGQNAWYNGQSIPNAAVVDKNTSGSTRSFATIVLPTNVLRLDGENFIADVRWTAPTSGVYNLSGFFQRIDDGGTPVSVRVILNGTTTLFSADNFTTFNSQQAFSSSNLSLSAGAVLDFAEGAPQFNNDSTGLSATITNNAVPEPSSLTMLGCGIAGLLWGSWRHGRTRHRASSVL